jgi:hypothetical protein
MRARFSGPINLKLQQGGFLKIIVENFWFQASTTVAANSKSILSGNRGLVMPSSMTVKRTRRSVEHIITGEYTIQIFVHRDEACTAVGNKICAMPNNRDKNHASLSAVYSSDERKHSWFLHLFTFETVYG